MEKFSYNSYPDSAESSPRSRDVDFDNPPPWEDQQQQTHSYKVKFMCSYGGKIQPRPHDNQLTYVNGDTKILSVDRGIRFPALASKLSAVIGGDGGEISFKYQLPGEDLDALISVTNEDDLEHMMHEYDRLLRVSSKPARMRLFLFPSSSISGGFGSEGSTKSDRETMNPIPNRPDSEKSVTAPTSNADFLFGSEKVVSAPAPPPVMMPQQIQDPEPLMFVNQQQVMTPEHGVNTAEIQRQIHEFQRIQIRDQEQHQHQIQQQEAMYRRKSEDGRYFTPTYAQNPPPPPPQTTVSQANTQPTVGYWQGNNNNNVPGNNMYTTTLQNQPEQQVYMIPAQSQAPGTLYHSVMRPPTQGNQGYYPPVQRLQQHLPDSYMDQQNQQGYNVLQPQQPYSGGPQVMSGVSAPMGLHETQPYSQMGNPVYYTVGGDGMMVQPQPQPHQPQYQGMGQPVSGMTELRTGPDGKVVVNTAPKVSSDSV